MWQSVIKLAFAALFPGLAVAETLAHQAMVADTLEACLTAAGDFDQRETTLESIGWQHLGSDLEKAAFSTTMYGIDPTGAFHYDEAHLRLVVVVPGATSALEMSEDDIGGRPVLLCSLKSTQMTTFNSIAIALGGNEVKGLDFLALEYPKATLVHRLLAEKMLPGKPVVQIETLLNLTQERD